MSANVGTVDRIIRLFLGLGLILAALFAEIPLLENTAYFYGAIAVGIVLAGTSALRFCPLYRIIGVKTCRV